MATSADDPRSTNEAGAADSDELAALHDEIAHLRARLADAPKRVHSLEERLLETKGQLAAAVGQNEKLSYTLREAREHIATLRDFPATPEDCVENIARLRDQGLDVIED